MTDPTHEPRGAATPPTCEEIMQNMGSAIADLQQMDRKDAKYSLALFALSILLVVAMVVGGQLFPEHAQRVRKLGMLAFLLMAGVFILGPVIRMRVSLSRSKKEGGWGYDKHILARHNCFIKNDGWATATGEIAVTPRFIALVKSGYLLRIPIYHTLVRPMQNRVQCIPLTPQTRVRFVEPTGGLRTMYRLDVQPGSFLDGDRVYLRPADIRKLLPALARLGVDASGPQGL